MSTTDPYGTPVHLRLPHGEAPERPDATTGAIAPVLRRSRPVLAVALAAGMFLWLLTAAAPAGADSVGLPRFPSISPDGSEIVFSWGGDLWRVSTEGGQATRLTSHALDDLHSSWSPDGGSVTFTSMRDGYLNLWRIDRDGTRLAQLTYSDRFMRNPAWGRDADGESVITFSGSIEGDVYRDERSYRLAPTGGGHSRLFDAFGSEPQLAPDGTRVAFTRGGRYHGWSRRHYRGPDAMDVWLHDTDDGSFTAVTTRDGDDGSAQWAGDDELVFMSDRELGTVNLYRVATSGDATPQRLTDFAERDILHFDVSRDGTTAVLQVWDTIYTLDLQGDDARPRPLALRAGEPGRDQHELRRIDRDITEAALSPDGQVMAHVAYGRVYVRHMDDHSATHAVTRGTHARHRDIAWSPDGLSLYFTSDADGTSSIYRARVTLTREEIRQAWRDDRHPPAGARTERRGSEPTPPGRIVTGEAGDAQAEAPDDRPDEDPFGPLDPVVPVNPLDPPAPAEPGDPGSPAASTPELPVEAESIPEDELEDDAAADLPAHLDPARWHDAVQFTVRPVVQSGHNDRDVRPSPDGRSIAFRRGRGDLVVMDLAGGDERILVQGWDSNLHWRWSPDSSHIAYAQNDLDFSANIFIVPADGSGEPVNITRHPRNDVNPRWSADGRKLSFISNRSNDTYDLYRVHLDRALENRTARERSTYYRDAREAAAARKPIPVQAPGDPAASGTPATGGEPLDLDLEDAWRRVERVTAGPGHVTANEMTPGGDRYIFNAQGEGLITVNWDGSDRRRLGPPVDVQHLGLTGSRLIYVADGHAGVVDLADGSHRWPGISDRIRIDLRAQALQKFHEAARMIRESFYRPDMKGLDWPAVVADYEELIRHTRTASEFSDIVNRLMGELAASHTGVSNPGPASALREPSGRLGIDHERVELADGRAGYRVTRVIPRGPAARGPMRLEPGDVITRIDGQPFGPRDTMLRHLRGRVGQELIVTFERQAGGGRRELLGLFTPVDFDEFAELRYDAFREDARRRVREWSDGRIGYIHIQAMNRASLEEFQGELYAAAKGRDGLIIDVRNNGGGHTTDRILTSIMAAGHAYTVPAGADRDQTGHYPQDRLDAPRYTLPINMLINEKSYSNAEILAHAFSTLERGTLVGNRTYGGVISTGSHALIDGAIVRLPFRGWYLPDGTDMEHNGARPDIRVEQRPEDEAAGRDPQLRRAVDDMLDQF